ncbi:MAG: HepT-like ribonuclease domain-containing protein [Chloroflexota bacterium]|nr:HepT-like ribonuclease domain-containing protein [Chloroflexota bacterium]
MNAQDELRLRHIRDAAQMAIQFSAGKARDDLDTDKMVLYAIVHALQVIGEAAARVSDAARDHYPLVAWKAIIGMRNRIVHDYLNIDPNIVWHVVTTERSDLVEKLDSILIDPSELD